jgi:hypothetical protein
MGPRLRSLPLLFALLLVACPELPDDDDLVVDDDDAADDDDSALPCLPGSWVECPVVSCAALFEQRPDAPEGLYWLDPAQDGAPFRTRCEAAIEGGGWTLLLVTADDGTNTWTWNARDLWTSDTSVVGDPEQLDRDFKSLALHELPFRDLLFRHLPSQHHLVYGDVNDGGTSLGGLLSYIGGPVCWDAGGGHAPTAGTVSLDGLCDDTLYLSPIDQDGDAGCDPEQPHRSDAWGPAWSAGGNDGCPFDDVGELSGLGPSALEDPAVEYGAPPAEVSRGVGFGQALGLNTGEPGSGENRMEVLAR